MARHLATVRVLTFNNGEDLFKQVTMTVTASGFLLSGYCANNGQPVARYYPRVKVKEIYINGIKTSKQKIQEDDKHQDNRFNRKAD